MKKKQIKIETSIIEAAAKKAKTTPEKFVASICSISAGREVCAHFLKTEGEFSVFQI